jgi:hypothetical protein
MILLTVTEGNGVITRVPVGVNAIALQMSIYFQDEAGLEVELDNVENFIVTDDQEEQRANYLRSEWRCFGNPLKAVS